MIKILTLISVLSIVLGGLIVYQGRSSKGLESTFVNSTPVPQLSEVRSLEGTMKLLMEKKENSDKTVLYTFSVTDQSGKTIQILKKTVTRGETMSLPRNSWSPNNKYVFVEDRQGSFADYLVFKTNGETFLDGQKYLNATLLFAQKVKSYKLKAITGWDDPVLMSVLTVNGPRFWFDLTTSSFIQLVK